MSSQALSLDGVHLIDPATIRRAFEIPDWFKEGMQPTLDANPKFKPLLLPAIVKAVEHSFNHADTRMRGEVPMGEVRHRIKISCGLIVKMYFERKLSLHQTLDTLPGVLVDMIRMGSESSALVLPRQGRWAADTELTVLGMEDNDLNQEADDVDGT
jgi:hypothetical protein